MTIQSYPDGVFSWIDIATTDIDGAKAFYGGLFGWTSTDIPLPDDAVYVMFFLNGLSVAGCGSLSEEMAQQGMPPFWTSYINHSDVDEVAEKARQAGGQVPLEPMDVMESGRMTMIQGPSGAVVGVWQPKDHTGAEVANEYNSLVWNELQTRDPEGDRAFYKSVFGWTDAVDENGYIIFSNNDRMQAGAMEMDESWDEHIPSNWSIYFRVEDIEDAAAKVRGLGGTVVVPPSPAGEIGTFSVVQDPQGATFNLIQTDRVDEIPDSWRG